MPDCFKLICIWFLFTSLLFSRFCHAEEYIFSAPPTDDRKTSIPLYAPIAEYLSTVTGEKFVYEYPQNWPNYISTMQRADYDLVIDAPHFVSWRIENIEHSPMVGIAWIMTYVVVHRASEQQTLMDLKGKSVCSSALPNLDALTLMDQYDSIWSQPLIKATQGYENMLARLEARECDAAIVPRRVFDRHARNFPESKHAVLFESSELPHLGFSSGPAIDREMQKKIGLALISDRSSATLSGLKNKYALEFSDKPVLAAPEMYSGYAYLLSDFWGF
jgi:ABC-type phosphate/phosphonate transport system substrate-binding protein